MKTKLLCALILTILLISCNSRVKHDSPKKVENNILCGTKSPHPPEVFESNCSTCHFKERASTGPKLEYILTRVPSEKWFDDYVRNEDSLAKSGDKYILKIQNYSPIDSCHHFKNLTDVELKIIKDYLSEISD